MVTLLNEDDGQPFLDRTPFSYLKPNSVIVGMENKQTVLEHNKEKIIDIKIKDNKLILECSMYLKNNGFDYPITSLCKNKNNTLIFDSIN